MNLFGLTVSFDSGTGFLFLSLLLVVLAFRPELGRAIDRLQTLKVRDVWASFVRSRCSRNGR